MGLLNIYSKKKNKTKADKNILIIAKENYKKTSGIQ